MKVSNFSIFCQTNFLHAMRQRSKFIISNWKEVPNNKKQSPNFVLPGYHTIILRPFYWLHLEVQSSFTPCSDKEVHWHTTAVWWMYVASNTGLVNVYCVLRMTLTRGGHEKCVPRDIVKCRRMQHWQLSAFLIVFLIIKSHEYIILTGSPARDRPLAIQDFIFV